MRQLRDSPSLGRSVLTYSSIQVLIGFLGTAYLTLVLVTIYYFIDCGSKPTANVIDRGIIDFLWRRFSRRPNKKWGTALRRAVLMFSDQQVVTGIAILVAGFSQLHCGLASFHWKIIVALAWFSSLTHLTTLTVLYQYFRDNPVIRNWRAAFMLITVILLGTALVPTGNRKWPGTIEVPTLCFFDELAVDRSGYGAREQETISMFIIICFLLISYVTRIIKLSKRSSDFTRRWLRSKPGNLLKKCLDGLNRRAQSKSPQIFWALGHQLLLGTFVVLMAIYDIFGCTLWEVRNYLSFYRIYGDLHESISRLPS